MEFNEKLEVGDWVILKDEYREQFKFFVDPVDVPPVQISRIENCEAGISLYVFLQGEISKINKSSFRLATESEIKKEQLKNIFSTQKRGTKNA